MAATQDYYKVLANTLKKKMEKRNFETTYCETGEEAKDLALSMIPDGAVVAAGGSVTVESIGLMDAVKGSRYNFIDRKAGKTPEEKRQLVADGMMAHTFLMSANAITKDGELVNIDGYGNRIALMAYGPEQVIIIVSLNKLANDVEDAINRIHNVAAPINCQRLGRKTPCHETGVCGDCLSLDSVCGNTIVTRLNLTPGRIKVILVGENLGY